MARTGTTSLSADPVFVVPMSVAVQCPSCRRRSNLPSAAVGIVVPCPTGGPGRGPGGRTGATGLLVVRRAAGADRGANHEVLRPPVPHPGPGETMAAGNYRRAG